MVILRRSTEKRWATRRTTMAYRWPVGTTFKRIALAVEDRSCPVCDRSMHVCDHRYHAFWTFEGPTQVVNRLVRCPDPSCQSRGRTFSPEAELSISMPRWCIGWDVLCWLGHRRFARHWSVPQLRLELKDTHQIALSDDAIEHYIGLYQTMLAACQQAPDRLADAYRDIASLVLTIDGLQPEKGHETLYVVRELMSKRVWFAEPLLSSATQEVQRLIVLARQWADHVAKPVLEIDSHAKVTMRRKVRGLRAIERGVLEERRQATAPEPTPPHETSKADAAPLSELPAAAAPVPCASSDVGVVRMESPLEVTGVAAAGEPGVEDEAGEVVLGYCAVVRGILNDSLGGPLHPPGVRMSEALQDVRDSLERNLQAQKGGVERRC